MSTLDAERATVGDRVAARLAGRRSAVLGDLSTRDVLEPLGLPFVPMVEVSSAAEAVAAAAGFGRVVLKLLSDRVVHKSEAGLVLLDVDPADADTAYELLMARGAAAGADDGRVVVQPAVEPGVDLFIGVSTDQVFGPVLIVGLGGTTVELFRDVTRRVVPVTAADARTMLESLVSHPLLAGFRGGLRYDVDEFCALVARVSELVTSVDEVDEFDLNPVRLHANGQCAVLDARLGLRVTGPRAATAVRGEPDLGALLRPRTIAVVGASVDSTRPGGRVVRHLLAKGFTGTVWPVNRSGGTVSGLPSHTSLAALPGRPDHVCVALPADAAIEAVAECVAAGVPAVTVLASGFAETGGAGVERERRLRELVRGTATVLCGPNTIGLVSPSHRMAMTFSQGVDAGELSDSGTCVIAQSGAVAGSLVSRELVRGYGIGDWVTVGNQADLDVSDYLTHLVGLPTTRSVALFLEGVDDGNRLRAALAGARAADVPVVVFKTGVTELGGRAVASHSGALAGAGETYEAVLAQEGAVQVREVTALLEVAWVLGRTRRPRGRAVAVVSTSGGAASAVADMLDREGLTLASLGPETEARLTAALPSFAHVANPLDVTAEGTFAPGVVQESVTALCADPGVDIVCVVLTSVGGDDAVRVAEQIAAAAGEAEKPVLVTWLIAAELAVAGQRVLVDAGIRVFEEPGRMVAALGHLVRSRSGS